MVQKHYAAAALGRLAGNADNRVAIAKATKKKPGFSQRDDV